MRRVKELARRLFCLPAVPTVLICLPSYALVFGVLWFGVNGAPLAYIAYALSAYALCLTCTGLFRLANAAAIKLLPHLERQPMVYRYLHEEQFRIHIALWRGAALNLAYVGIKLYYGITGRSAWFVTLAGYYLLLLLMRASILHLFQTGSASAAAALRRVRFCGVLLLAMNIIMTIMVISIVEGGMGFVYSGNMIYIMTLYAFYAVGRAVAQFVRFGRRRDILLAAVKGLDFVTALVSMLALETAMIAAFSDESEDFRRMMTGISGTAVCVFVLALAIYTIVSTTRRLRRIANQ